MSKFTYDIAGLTDIGLVKKENEDAFYIGTTSDVDKEQIILALVADGMGGTAYGKLAANTIKYALKNWFLNQLPAMITASSTFEEALLNAWDAVIARCNTELNGIDTASGKTGGSTLTMLFLYGGTYYIANIGDSRIYRYTNGSLYQVTKDHSWAQQALEEGMDPKKIEADARNHMITRCIGGKRSRAEADYFADFYSQSDYFLICSDGLRHLISTTELMQLLENEETTTKNKLQTMINIVKDRGERDNITGILIKVERQKANGA